MNIDFKTMLQRMISGERDDQIHIDPDKRALVGETVAAALEKAMRDNSDDPEAASKPLCVGCVMIGLDEAVVAAAKMVGADEPGPFLIAMAESLLREAERR